MNIGGYRAVAGEQWDLIFYYLATYIFERRIAVERDILRFDVSFLFFFFFSLPYHVLIFISQFFFSLFDRLDLKSLPLCLSASFQGE